MPRFSSTPPVRTGDALPLVRRSLRWAERHVVPELRLRDVANAMGVSPFQLQRAFQHVTGMGVMSAVRQDRLRRAAMRLAFRHGQSVTQIALDSGFASAEGFTRAFHRVMGISPSQFRAQPDWEAWRGLRHTGAHCGAPVRARSDLLQAWQRAVTVVTMPSFRVLALMYTPNGAYQTITDALGAFITWRRTRGNLHPRTHATWNLLHAPPVPSMSPTTMLAVATADRLTAADRAAGIVECQVPRGRYARLRLEGSDTLIRPAIECLRDVWCAERSVSPANGPVLLRRVRVYPDVAEHDACSDLYLPLPE